MFKEFALNRTFFLNSQFQKDSKIYTLHIHYSLSIPVEYQLFVLFI